MWKGVGNSNFCSSPSMHYLIGQIAVSKKLYRQISWFFFASILIDVHIWLDTVNKMYNDCILSRLRFQWGGLLRTISKTRWRPTASGLAIPILLLLDQHSDCHFCRMLIFILKRIYHLSPLYRNIKSASDKTCGLIRFQCTKPSFADCYFSAYARRQIGSFAAPASCVRLCKGCGW